LQDLFFIRIKGLMDVRSPDWMRSIRGQSIVSEIVGAKHGDAGVRNPWASKVESEQRLQTSG